MSIARAPRLHQPCWCPDANIASACYVAYCPRHGERPARSLWDHGAHPWPDPDHIIECAEDCHFNDCPTACVGCRCHMGAHPCGHCSHYPADLS